MHITDHNPIELLGYVERLKQARRRWMRTRDPRDRDRFAALVQEATAATKRLEADHG